MFDHVRFGGDQAVADIAFQLIDELREDFRIHTARRVDRRCVTGFDGCFDGADGVHGWLS